MHLFISYYSHEIGTTQQPFPTRRNSQHSSILLGHPLASKKLKRALGQMNPQPIKEENGEATKAADFDEVSRPNKLLNIKFRFVVRG